MPDSVILDSVVPDSTFACYAQFRCARFPQALATSAFELMGNAVYEAEIVKRGMNSIALQPLVADQAFMSRMKAMYVPFHMGYGSLICY